MRLGRKKDTTDDIEGGAPGGPGADGDHTLLAGEEDQPVPVGPADADTLDELDAHIDLGSLLVPPVQEGTELRLQVDEASGAVLAVLLVSEDGMLELRAFAAARNGDLWSDVRHEIAADTARRGGTADEVGGPFGPELYCQVPVQLDDGSGGVQPSRVIGWNGPRWFLRATLLGKPAMERETAGPWEDTIRSIVVRRGNEALPPGEPLPLHLPPESRRIG